MTELFEQFLPAKWRDVEFPVTKMRMSLAHDLVEHKYWGRDGARVEATGLAPIRFSFSSPLTNGIVPGKGETWSILYPNQFRALVTAFQQRETGELQHPEFGIVECKAERLDIDWDAGRRGGADTEMSFVQTLPDDADIARLFEASPVQEIELAALSLDSDNTRVDLRALLAAKGIRLPTFENDCMDLVRRVQAVVDTPTLLQNRLAGRIDSIVYRFNKVADSAERAREAYTWPTAQDREKVNAAAHELRQDLLKADRPVAYYRVRAETTIAGLARLIPGATVGDIMTLNPSLMTRPTVPENTRVRHYVKPDQT